MVRIQDPVLFAKVAGIPHGEFVPNTLANRCEVKFISLKHCCGFTLTLQRSFPRGTNGNETFIGTYNRPLFTLLQICMSV
jgi:hypothetical protein